MKVQNIQSINNVDGGADAGTCDVREKKMLPTTVGGKPALIDRNLIINVIVSEIC